MNRIIYIFLIIILFVSCGLKGTVSISPAEIVLGDNVDILIKDLEPNKKHTVYLTKVIKKKWESNLVKGGVLI